MIDLKKRTAINIINFTPFLKNVVKLSLGSIGGQILGFIFLPLLSRLYLPQEYGLYSTFLGVAQIMILFSTLKYDKSIILPRQTEDVKRLVLLTFLIVTIYATTITVALFVLYFLEVSFNNIGKYIYFIPVSVLGYGYLSVINNWCQKEEEFGLISKLGIAQSVINIFISLLLGIYKFDLNGLILGWITSCQILVFCFFIFKREKITGLFLDFKKGRLVSLFNRYINFPKYYLFYDVLSSGIAYVVPVIVTMCFSQYDCGLFSMAYRILMVPFIVISSSVSNVFIVNANKQYTLHNSFSEFYKKTFFKILAFGLVIYTLSFLIGGRVVITLLGTEWREIDPFVKILSIWLFFEFIVIVFKSNTYIIVQKQKLGLIVQIFSTVISLSSLIWFSKFGIQTALVMFTISMSTFSIINLFLTYRLSRSITYQY